jgi:hypothetical protein
MNTAGNAGPGYHGHATFISAAALLLCVLALVRVPGWWRGSYNSGQSLGRQRTYLVQWVGCTSLMIGTVIASPLLEDADIADWLAWLALIFWCAGAVFIVLIPLVWHFKAFEFLVAPGLRRDVPDGPPDFGSGRPLGAAVAAAMNAPERAPAQMPAATGPDGSGELRFERPRAGRRDLLVAYRVEVDGGQVGTLRRGAEFTVPVAAGIHTVQGMVHFTGSPKLEVQVRAGETTVVRIKPMMVGNPLVQVAAPDTYLAIEVAGN